MSSSKSTSTPPASSSSPQSPKSEASDQAEDTPTRTHYSTRSKTQAASMSQTRPSAGSSRVPHAASATSQSGSSGSGLYNRLHPPSSMPPEQYDPSNYGYSASNAPRPSHHFARIPPQKKSELWARVARLENATQQYVDHRAQNALKRSMLPNESSASGKGKVKSESPPSDGNTGAN